MKSPIGTNRRQFIKQLGAVSALGLFTPTQVVGTPDPFTITLFQTTDIHCQVHPHDELFWENGKVVFRKTGGYANLCSYLRSERQKNPDSFVIDTGDMFQGSELAVKTVGKAMVPILDAVGYDLFLPGNWEVVYGKAAMQSLLNSLLAPTVCANMYQDLDNGKRGELLFPPYYIWNVKGVKIGFLGYTDPLVPIRQSPNYSKGITYTNAEENLAHYVHVLREVERCAYVLILSHLGLSQQIHLSNLEECKGVDYILGGDTHERVRKPIQGKYAKVVEPGAFGSFIGKLTLTVEKGKITRDEYELVELSSGKYNPTSEITDLIRNNEAPFEKDIDHIAGYSTLPLYRYFVIENTIDTLILDALRWKLKDIDIVLSNGFRFCPPRATPDHTGNIPITNGFIYDMLPVDSVVRTAEVTGKQIRDWLEIELNNVFAKEASQRIGGWVIKFNGMKIEFNAYGEMGNRVKTATVNDEPIQPDKLYRISACERDGDPNDVLCRIKAVVHARNTPFSLHNVIKQYLQANSPVTPTPPLFARVLDAPQALLTQVRGVDYQFS